MLPPAGATCGGGGSDTAPSSPVTAWRSSPLYGTAQHAARWSVAGEVAAAATAIPACPGSRRRRRRPRGGPCWLGGGCRDVARIGCPTPLRRHGAAHHWPRRPVPVAIGCWRGGCRRYVSPPRRDRRGGPPRHRAARRGLAAGGGGGGGGCGGGAPRPLGCRNGRRRRHVPVPFGRGARGRGHHAGRLGRRRGGAGGAAAHGHAGGGRQAAGTQYRRRRWPPPAPPHGMCGRFTA